MRLIVCGTRTFDDYPLLRDWLDGIAQHEAMMQTLVIVHGAARGADSLASRWARERGYSEEGHPADWQGTAGRYAGPARNLQIAKAGADLCLAFWDGKSPGTLDMIRQAVRFGIPVRIVPTTVEERTKVEE
jgi:hypothetical protein